MSTRSENLRMLKYENEKYKKEIEGLKKEMLFKDYEYEKLANKKMDKLCHGFIQHILTNIIERDIPREKNDDELTMEEFVAKCNARERKAV